MATLNVARLKVQLAKDPNGKLKTLATKRATAIFDEAVDNLKTDFEDSRVTQEIDGGIEASNVSDTLRGGEAPENLFSFIGFEAGDKPTDAIRERLEPTHRDGPKLLFDHKNEQTATWIFRVKSPDREGIYEATPLPWAAGLSWAKKIETGIAGFAHFLARLGLSNSRSGGGIQATKGGQEGAPPQEIRSAQYTPPAEGYLNTLFNRFIERIKDASKVGGRIRGSGGRFTPFE